jgi:hypothetical protein
MRYLAPIALVLLAGCGSSPSAEDSARTTSASVTPALVGDASDTACQVVLRHTNINFESRLGPQTDCSSGTCWVVITVTLDVAMSQSLAGGEAFVLYQGEGSTAWQYAQAQPVLGCDELPDGPCAPVGFRRYQVVLRSDTFTSGGDQTVHLIPYLWQAGGNTGRLFDHNRVADPMGNYVLDMNNNWTIGDDASACPGTTPAGRLTANFATGWQNSSSGSLVGGGKLDVNYDIYRMAQTLSCTTDGVPAFATLGYVRFQPSGQTLMEIVNGPFDSTKNQYDSIPLEFDVPPGTTSAALWFYTSSDCNAPGWDSDYGQNYVFTAAQ